MRAYSTDLRVRAVFKRTTLVMSYEAVARDLAVSSRTVRRYVARFIHEHTVLPRQPLAPGRPRALTGAAVQAPDDLLRSRSDWRLCQLVHEMQAYLGHPVSVSTVHRAVCSLGYTFKKLSVEAAERNELVRADFMYRINLEMVASQLVFLDESSVDARTSSRGYGYSLHGRRARYRAPFIRGDRYTLTAAICTEGILAFDVIEGSSNAQNFTQFCIDSLILLMNPFPGPNSVLIMDNCIIHHNAEALQLLTEAGIRVEFLPPYSPDFNPIEEAFHTMKAWLRNRHDWLSQVDAVTAITACALESADADMAKNFMRHSGYTVDADLENYAQD